MSRALRISHAAWTAIVTHARRDAPLECCGLLVGEGAEIVRAVPSSNLEASPVRYTIDPRAYLSASREGRSLSLDVIGAYHSHPSSAPCPSPTDLAEGVEAPFIYLIAGPVDAGADLAVRAWRKEGGTFVELDLRVALPEHT